MKIKDLLEMYSNQPQLDVHRRNGQFIATDNNTYDGADDGNNHIGWGETKQEALEDLIGKLEDAGMYSRDELEYAVHEYLDIEERGNMEMERRMGVQDENPRF